MSGDVWRQVRIVELRLPGTIVCLDEESTGQAVRDHSLEASLEAASSAENNNSADLTSSCKTTVRVASRSFDLDRLKSAVL